MFAIAQRPIVILSSARTGSNALTEYIHMMCNDVNMKIFREPDFRGFMNEFTDCYYGDAGKNFILKTHLCNLPSYNTDIIEFLTHSQCVFRIKLLRRDVVRQIASQYIGEARNKKWRYRSADSVDTCTYTKPIPIDSSSLTQSMVRILRQNRAFVECKIRFDLELWYEDLPAMTGADHVVTPKPANYQEVLDAIDRYRVFIDRVSAG